jgi:hypothetical protein
MKTANCAPLARQQMNQVANLLTRIAQTPGQCDDRFLFLSNQHTDSFENDENLIEFVLKR